MNPVAGVLVYLILWVLVFMAALPFGVRGQWEGGEVQDGTEPGAPVNPMLGKKALWTTAIAAGIWLVLFIVVTAGWIGIDDLPGPDSYWE